VLFRLWPAAAELAAADLDSGQAPLKPNLEPLIVGGGWLPSPSLGGGLPPLKGLADIGHGRARMRLAARRCWAAIIRRAVKRCELDCSPFRLRWLLRALLALLKGVPRA